MIESISVLFSGLASAAKTAEVVQGLLRRRRGDTRVLLEEVKENLGLCWAVIEYGVDPMEVIPRLATVEYDRLLREGFNFNRLGRRKRIRGSKRLARSDLSPFIGKETADLVESIYDRVKELKRLYRVCRDNPRINWRRRIINLLKRMLLLVEHVRGREV